MMKIKEDENAPGIGDTVDVNFKGIITGKRVDPYNDKRVIYKVYNGKDYVELPFENLYF